MALGEIKASYVVLVLILLSFKAKCSSPFRARRVLTTDDVDTVFDVTNFGAKPDGKTDSSLAFIKAWDAACKSGKAAKVFFPKGTFLSGEVVFQGPCNTPTPTIIEIRGTILASTDLSLFTQGVWISIENVNGIVVTGGGTLDGQGACCWKYSTQEEDSANPLPVSLQVGKVQNGVIRSIKSVNSKGFHTKVTLSSNITVENLNISAPENSPNTDGLHISSSQHVNVTNINIGTGDDCISIGEGSTNIAISKITCGPGHGISIGSLGRRLDEKDVKGVTVKNCTLTGTTNGARIKTFNGSPPLQASAIIYEDIIMNQVKNPVIIDQNYNSVKMNGQSSGVQISNAHFRKFTGTVVPPVVVNLDCNGAAPCQDIELADILLTAVSEKPPLSSTCNNVKPTFSGNVTLGQGSCR